MRSEEMRVGIDVYPSLRPAEKSKHEESADSEAQLQSLGKSRAAAKIAVAETALSRVLNSTPIMVLPPLILVQLQKTRWMRARPRAVLPVNLGLILTTSVFALPLALGAFPTRQVVGVGRLEREFWGGGRMGEVEFNRGI